MGMRNRGISGGRDCKVERGKELVKEKRDRQEERKREKVREKERIHTRGHLHTCAGTCVFSLSALCSTGYRGWFAVVIYVGQ